MLILYGDTMVKIQIDLPENLSRYIAIQREIYSFKDKRETIIRMLQEDMENEKELMKKLNKISKKVKV